MNATVLRRLVHTELLLALREPVSMFMSVILPLAVFLALGFSVGSMEIEVDRDSGIVEMFHARDVLLAGNIAWVTAVFGIVALPQTLVEFRQHGHGRTTRRKKRRRRSCLSHPMPGSSRLRRTCTTASPASEWWSGRRFCTVTGSVASARRLASGGRGEDSQGQHVSWRRSPPMSASVFYAN